MVRLRKGSLCASVVRNGNAQFVRFNVLSCISSVVFFILSSEGVESHIKILTTSRTCQCSLKCNIVFFLSHQTWALIVAFRSNTNFFVCFFFVVHPNHQLLFLECQSRKFLTSLSRQSSHTMKNSYLHVMLTPPMHRNRSFTNPGSRLSYLLPFHCHYLQCI